MTSMAISETTVRRGLYGMLAGGLIGAAATAMIVLPSAKAAPGRCDVGGAATAQAVTDPSSQCGIRSTPNQFTVSLKAF